MDHTGNEPTAPPAPVARRALTVAGGALKAFGATSRGMALDATAGLLRGAEKAAEAATGRSTGLSTLPIRVLILSDESGRPLTTSAQMRSTLDRADRIFTEHAGIRVRVHSIETIAEPAPTHALNPRSNQRLLLDHIAGKTTFFDSRVPRRRMLSVVGDPVTVVVVRTISGRTTGCSLGMTADWVICQATLFDAGNERTYDETVVAHELGHALNLPHVRDQGNLMNALSSPPDKMRGTHLRPWQAMILQSNRHIVPPV